MLRLLNPYLLSGKLTFIVLSFSVCLLLTLLSVSVIQFVGIDEADNTYFNTTVQNFAQKHAHNSPETTHPLILEEAKSIQQHLSKGFIQLTLLSQFIYNFLCYFVCALLFRQFVYPKGKRWLDTQPNTLYSYFLVLGILFSALPILSQSVSINELIGLNELLQKIQPNIQENNLISLLSTYVLVDTSTPIAVIMSFIVMALIPALGEELLFRGAIQKSLHEHQFDSHKAIFITALLFSVLHFEFTGFFYRFLLGALFGYVYFWSKNILYPIFMHFCNNALSLVFLMYNNESINQQENTEDQSVISLLLLATLSLVILIYLFYQNTTKHTTTSV